jgi:hypothetical protein
MGMRDGNDHRALIVCATAFLDKSSDRRHTRQLVTNRRTLRHATRLPIQLVAGPRNQLY